VLDWGNFIVVDGEFGAVVAAASWASVIVSFLVEVRAEKDL